ncbi:MAG: ABC transporter ATP-binding protein/permease [Oscillospiraceae bacterium]|jgi:ATP-binding cassette subfamily B protein|nr:ABC transporter ATP-binding protein/permease [Oscillospiraceae bacterium]
MPPPGGPRGARGFLTPEEKRNRPKITGALLRRIFSYLTPYLPQMSLVMAAIIISSFFSVYPSILTGGMVDAIAGNPVNISGPVGAAVRATAGGDPFKILLTLIGLSFALFVVSNLISLGQSYLNAWIAQHISFDMKNALYAHLQKMSHRFFSASRQGDIITRMTSDADGVQQTITGTLTQLISNSSTLVIALVAMCRKNWILAAVGVVMVPFFVIPTKTVGRKRWELTRKSQEKNDEINQILNETLSVSGQLLVKLFTAEEREYEKYHAANSARVALSIRESMAGRWFMFVIGTFTNIGPMLIYLVGGLLIMRHDGSLTVGDITIMVSLLNRLYMPVNALLNIRVDLIRSMALFTRLFEYFDMKPEIESPPGAVIPGEVKGDISFKRVSFRYEPGKDVLKDISFDVPSGKSVAIVGPSGAGKSTIINLIPRLYDVTDGAVRLDGRDIRELDLAFLRSCIGVVNQDTYLFNGSIRENLLYAKPYASEAELVSACRDANIHDFIATLPDGYDTVIGNRGVKLSGGERQRLSIARAMLKNAKILILDEATSSLDSISESLIQDAIAPLLRGRTSIVIAHRLSTVMSADEILVVKDGVITERGTHRELVPKNGVYTELYETQFRRALEERDSYQPMAVKPPSG